MMRNFYVSAIYTSPNGSMGGNTKILIELINNLCSNFNFIIFTTEPRTFINNLKNLKKVKIVKINYPFKKFNYFNHFSEVTYISKIYRDYFKEHKIYKDDYFFSQSDFAPDVLPIYFLKRKYSFKWIASVFLFIPNPLENLKEHYGFPLIKYAIYYLYQGFLFYFILKKGNLFLITNDYDKKYFPQNFDRRILAIYGGVNPEQIVEASKQWDGEKKYDAVFCSRLHPQKGISQLLEIWVEVVKQFPTAKLAIIGNGEIVYEQFLKIKASKLGINNNLEWFGYVNGINKYRIYLESKIFLHSTVYDNNGMVAAEALCSGLPVIMYDLPQLKKIYSKGCYKVEILNKKMYASKIICLLNKFEKRKISLSLDLRLNLLEYWSWKTKSQLFLNFLKNEISH